MVRVTPLVAALFVLPLLGSGSPNDHDDGAAKLEGIDGTWRLTSRVVDGKSEFVGVEFATFLRHDGFLATRAGEPTNLHSGPSLNRVLHQFD